MMVEFLGGCSCSKVRFSSSSTPLRVGICHCLDCRKHHGAIFYAAAVFAKCRVQIEGQTKHTKGRHFCPDCGSSVFAITGDEIELHLGSFDTPNELEPSYETWCIHREKWLPPFPNTKQYMRDRNE